MSRMKPSADPSPGWYPDPPSKDERYWDGSAWTDQTRPAKRELWPLLLGAGATLAVALVLVSLWRAGVFGEHTLGRNGETDLQAAYTSCLDPQSNPATIDLADQGHTIVITGARRADLGQLLCILSELGTPSSVTADISSTTALMGRQTADANGYHYVWSYHPDNGVDMVITEG